MERCNLHDRAQAVLRSRALGMPHALVEVLHLVLREGHALSGEAISLQVATALLSPKLGELPVSKVMRIAEARYIQPKDADPEVAHDALAWLPTVNLNQHIGWKIVSEYVVGVEALREEFRVLIRKQGLPTDGFAFCIAETALTTIGVCAGTFRPPVIRSCWHTV